MSLIALLLLSATFAAAVDASSRAPASAQGGASAAARPAEFDAERIQIRIAADSVEVEGTYQFLVRPGLAGAFTILYPYPLDPRLGGARTVRVEARGKSGEWRPVAFREAPGAPGSIWFLPLDLGDTLEVRGLYRQALRERYARYIVTTTASWGRPLRSARFEITLPPGARPRRFSHLFRRVAGTPDLYAWQARDFLPKRDIEVEWSAPRRP